MTPSRTDRRAAFTLIELLIVVAIMAILASLLLAAVFRAMAVVTQVQTRSEISQLASAIADFKSPTGFNVDYLPSSLVPGDPYWTRLFPQAGPYAGPALYGNACLVFLLGGVGGQGFSSDPSNPLANPFAGEIRKGPFFTFPTNRLNANGMFVDPYQVTPYAYCSTTGTPGSYIGGSNGNPGFAGPYTGPGGTYLNPDSFQIVSAGANMQFNPGTSWPGVTGVGWDDLSNFATGPLGTGQ